MDIGCLILLGICAITWGFTYALLTVLAWMLDFTVTAGLVTAVWLLILVWKILF